MSTVSRKSTLELRQEEANAKIKASLEVSKATTTEAPKCCEPQGFLRGYEYREALTLKAIRLTREAQEAREEVARCKRAYEADACRSCALCR